MHIIKPHRNTSLARISRIRSHAYLSTSKYTSVRNRRDARRLKSKYRFDPRGNGFIVYTYRYDKFLEDTETISPDFVLRLPG